MAGKIEFDCRFINIGPRSRHAPGRILPRCSPLRHHPAFSPRLPPRTSSTSHDPINQIYKSNYRLFPLRWFHLRHFPPPPRAPRPFRF